MTPRVYSPPMPSPVARFAAGIALVVAVAVARDAAADPYQLGGFFGPRFFSDDAALGTAPTFHTSLGSTVALGGRVARPVRLLRVLGRLLRPGGPDEAAGQDARPEHRRE